MAVWLYCFMLQYMEYICTTAEGVAVWLYVAVHGVHLYYCGGGCCMCEYMAAVQFDCIW